MTVYREDTPVTAYWTMPYYFCILLRFSFCDSSNRVTTRNILPEPRLRLHYYHRINYIMEGRTIIFNGDSNEKEFITKVELFSALNGYSCEKSAQYLASKLEGRAFDVYLRLGDEDRNNVAKIQKELLVEFERGNVNREEALFMVSN